MDTLLICSGNKLTVELDHRGDHTCGTIRRGRHNAAAGRVFFPNSKGKGTDPVKHCERIICERNLFKTPLHAGGAARDLISAREHSFGSQTAVHRFLHHAPDMIQLAVNLLIGAPDALILADDFRNRFPIPAAECDEFHHVLVAIRKHHLVKGGRNLRNIRILFAAGNDKAAAHRVEAPGEKRMPLSVKRRHVDRVCVETGNLLRTESDVPVPLETDFRLPSQLQTAVITDIRENRGFRVHIERFRLQPHEAKHKGCIGRVPLAGCPKTSHQIHSDPCDPRQHIPMGKHADEKRGGSHRSHRVR